MRSVILSAVVLGTFIVAASAQTSQKPSSAEVGVIADNVTSNFQNAEKLIVAPAYGAGAAHAIGGIEKEKREHDAPDTRPQHRR